MLDLIPPGRAVSIEREVFPRLVEEGSLLRRSRCAGYWLDVGTPESYLQAHRDVLERNVETEVGKLLGRDYTHCGAGSEVDARRGSCRRSTSAASIGAGARIGSVAVDRRGRRRSGAAPSSTTR